MQYASSHPEKLPEHTDGVTLTLNELLQYKSQTVRWLPPGKSLWSQLSGQHHSRQKGRGMNFSEVRKYQPGDDIRSIDWRVTARTGKPHTKLFTEERERPVILYLDFSASMRFGSVLMLKSVQMAHMASLISWLATTQNDRIGAVLDSGTQLTELRPTSRNKGSLQLLHTLTEQHNDALQTSQEEQQPLEAGLKALQKLCPKGSDIIILSDFTRYSPDDKTILSQLRRHNQLQFIHIYDPLETGNTRYRGTEKVTNNNSVRWLNFSALSTRKQLEQAFLRGQNDLQSLCASLAIPYYSISSAQPLISQIVGKTE
ncbi:DUF58 domain-containing protein [Vibrio albus]|uniref:DUF58 domain-containing protein n=1 Tax=Vibrio albus TaxID=2200953 RepID=A0A2U3B7E7_9VIBR|nr:DUF58 domain-containing protein [Vibrio albus]PWI32654.1 DUF58 domain-containing protein [Vibrio albus]